MTTLHVIPASVYRMLEADGIALSCLRTQSDLVATMSVTDLAEITLAQRRFPYDFDKATDIQLPMTPYARLACVAEYTELCDRLSARLESLELHEAARKTTLMSHYDLYPVDDSLWVAVEQRVHAEKHDPTEQMKRHNDFFSAMMANALYTRRFEDVCATNLFTYYLGSLPVAAA